MAQIISIIGVSGVGKTSLVRALNQGNQFALGLESHRERPFEAGLKDDPGYCLANQFDFLLHRAEQEQSLRADPSPALVDGGLDLDFHGFSRLFHARGWLSDSEFQLIKRFYTYIRSTLPPPDLFIHMTASQKAIRDRLASRDRINIASVTDTALLSTYLDEWLKSLPGERLYTLDVSREKEDYSISVPKILEVLAHLHIQF